MPHAIPRQPRARSYYWTAAAGIGAAIILGVYGTSSYIGSERWVDHSLGVRRAAYDWLIALLDAETGVRGYVAAGNPLFLDPYQRSVGREPIVVAQLRSLVIDDPAQIANVDATTRSAQVVLGDLNALVTLVEAGHRDEAIALVGRAEAKQHMDAFRTGVTKIRDDEEAILAGRRADADLHGWLAAIGAGLLTLVSCGFMGFAWRREVGHDALVTGMAREARSRLKTLSDLAAALSEAHTRRDVARVVIDEGMRAAGADTATLYMLDESGTALELLGDRGVAADVLDKIRRITASSGNPAFATLKSGEPIWAESEADYAKLYPALAGIKSPARRARAFWSLPLVVEGRSIGLLGMGFYEPRRFSADERGFVGTLGRQCAQALLRAARLEREEAARSWLVTTLRSIGDAVIATDAQGAVSFMNPIAERLTGWTEADARGRPLDDVFVIFSEITHAAVESPVARVLREGTVVGLANHTVLRSRRGAEIPIDDSGAPIRNERGELDGVVLVFRDVTDDKRVRQRNEFLAKAGEVLVSSLDVQATLATVARLAVPTLADWCAVDLADPEGPPGATKQVAVAHVDPAKVEHARQLAERYPPDVASRSGVPEVIRTGRPQLLADIPRELIDASAKDDEHRRLLHGLQLRSAMVVPLRARGRTLGAMTFVYAESERRYGEDDLRFAEDFARRAAMAIENAMALKETEEARGVEHALRAEAELASRAKDEFLATVSHELRTPLNAILGWTVTLRGRKPPEEIDRALGIIERNARVQTKLIEDVLDISRIISGKLALNLGPTNVADAILAVIETVTPAANAKDIAVRAEVVDRSLSITADADRLQQIVWNLLTNAVKFTPKGGRVSIGAARDGSEIEISVRDSGEGIRPDVLPIIFEPFQQADASTTRRHGGLGLGLAIVKQLVIAHGGSVAAESPGLGHGSTFIVRLPARSSVRAVARTARPPLRDSGPHEPVPAPPRLDGLRLLVVDDEEDAREVVSEVLRGHGAEVHVAASASEALDVLVKVKPDVIVSDIGMPETDGYTLVRRIRALPADLGGKTPAVALTAYARAEDAKRAFAAGYQMHAAKPIEPVRLVTIVANLGGKGAA